MPYGTIKVDNITFDNGGTDKLITVSGLFFSTSGALTVTGTISGGNVTAPTATFTTLTGTTTAGTTATFTSGSFTSLTGVTTTGTTATFTSGSFTSLTGVTTTVTSGVFSSGIATAPSVAIGSGTTYKPGIYSPGADQVAISTNGTGRLFVDASGRVGVGGASAGPLLLVNGTPGTSTTSNLLSVRNGSASNANNIAQVDFWCANTFGGNEAIAAIRALNPNAAGNNGGALVFATSLNGTATTPSERLRITNDGLVGLGTSSPGSLLDLRSASAPSLHISTTGYTPDYRGYSIDLSQAQQTGGINFTTSSPSAFLDLYAGGSASALGGWDGQIRFFTGGTNAYGTERARIDSSGRVGIGTTSPSQLLHVNGGYSLLNGIRISGADTANSIYHATALGISSSDYITFSSGAAGPTERLRITAAGNVGIGTTGPATLLDLSTTTSAKLNLTYPGFGIATLASDSTGSLLLQADEANTQASSIIQFKIDGGEKARIDSSGRLLVGTSTARSNLYNASYTPSVQFETVGSNLASRGLSLAYNNASDTGGALLAFITSRGSTAGSNTIVANNDELGSMNFAGADGTRPIAGASIAAYVDGTPGNLDMPGRLVFSTTADGAASPTERMRIANNGAVGVGDTTPASNTLRASFRGPSNIESALPVVSIVRTNNSGGGTGVAETGLDVRIPNTFNGAGEVKGINVFAAHNVGTSATYGIFAEAGGNPSYGNIYSGYFKVTQPDTNGGVVNYAVYAQANSTIGISSSGYSIGVTSETNNYVNNQNFRAVSLYTGASTQTVLSIIRNSSAIGSITTSTTATAYNTSSDYRLKENLVPLTGAIDRLQQIPVYRCNFIADPDRTVDCFIAHETQAVVPEAVHGTKDEVDNEGNPVYQGIDQSKLVPLLTAALQEAITEIASLKDRVAALEAS